MLSDGCRQLSPAQPMVIVRPELTTDRWVFVYFWKSAQKPTYWPSPLITGRSFGDLLEAFIIVVRLVRWSRTNTLL
ncbi:hypothetical protein [Streptomyces albus]|uniref:hypothetical protein n=1 Tax=Streptomyces TaxID=1883 RepID=UPI001FD9B362|nr:hypothetical protein [Streptomyces albus]UVN57438.1 hypothetical protein NR995_25135 [Streptomyces albus]